MCTLNLPHQYSLENKYFTPGVPRKTAALQAGFSLVEVLMAMLVMTFGLLGVGELIYLTAASGSLARSKETAITAAQDKLESLSDLYRRDPDSAELSAGAHGPEQTEALNPITGITLNRFEIAWDIHDVSDPRTGRSLQAKLVLVTVTPVRSAGEVNTRSYLNKALKVSYLLSRKQR